MSRYKPSLPFSVPMMLCSATSERILGVEKKTYHDIGIIFGTFKTFGGTERDVNGVYSIEDTATVETWYRPDIKSNCAVRIDGALYEILGTPENIEMRNQYCVFKVKRIKGGV